jgi:hypothetical protein
VDGASTSPEDIPLWLIQIDYGEDRKDGVTVNRLFAALYCELKRSAHAQMRKEHLGHTLSATALAHEAWFRLAEQTRTQRESRSHFLGLAAIMMRRILVNHAVAKHAAKQAVKRDWMLARVGVGFRNWMKRGLGLRLGLCLSAVRRSQPHPS